jgi:hypothetical protein
MLGREAGLALAVQPTGLIAAAAGPLLLSLVALLRTWSPLRAADQLLQAALYFAAWNTLFALVYLCLGWFRPRVDPKEAEQRHLPLSAAHFALRRLLHSSSVPLAGGLFTVLCWGALVLYYDEPYTI